MNRHLPTLLCLLIAIAPLVRADVSLPALFSDRMVLPTFTAPCLPAGVTAAIPGTLNRIFALIAKMKLSSAMTEAIATDPGIIGSEATEKIVPKFLTSSQTIPLSAFICLPTALTPCPSIHPNPRTTRLPPARRCAANSPCSTPTSSNE